MEDMAYIGANVITSEQFLQNAWKIKNDVKAVQQKVAMDTTAPE